MGKNPFNLDERGINIFRKICTTLYFITLYSLIGVHLYRQFVLHQPSREWNDIAIIITFNVIVLLGSVLYLIGNVNPKKIKLCYIIAGYLGFFLIGFAFTIFKYTVLLGQELSLKQVLNCFFIDLRISGILVIVLGILAYLGSRRIEEQIEE